MSIYNSIEELIGGTPLVRLSNIEKAHGLCCKLYAKLEYFNPTGSAKDRAASRMLLDAEKTGRIAPGATIIEPTSGNTGIALAALCCARGYRMILVMPETMSKERQLLAKAYGAELVLTPGPLGMGGSSTKALELAAEIPNSFIPSQFDNPANPQAHYETTGPEIYHDLGGDVAAFVAGIGTGGTVSGAGKYLKEKIKNVRIIGVEPADSPLISAGRVGPHKLQGIGANFVPGNFDSSFVDEIAVVTSDDAFSAAREISAREGFLVGISSGAALSAAIKEGAAAENEGRAVVALLPDTGERYLSTELFCEQ